MKKNLLALVVATSILGGCASTSSDTDYKDLGNKLSEVEYVVLPVVSIEQIRTPIHTIFSSSKIVFETYMTKAEGNKDYHTFLALTRNKSDEEIKAIYAEQSQEAKSNIKAFENSNEDITEEIVSLVADLFSQQELFSQLSHKSLFVSSGMSMFEIPSALDAIVDTYNEIDYLMGTVGHIYKLSSVMDSMNKAI